MITLNEIDKIYFSKTKEYFHEVISSYTNKNYRSAVVILYSVVICDIMLKLEELRDTYNDGTATEILKRIQQSRQDNGSKSKWEWELIEAVKEKTKFLDSEAYMKLQHLRDYRNMCAHPAMNDELELYAPNQETVIALIRNSLETVFVKPPIFIKSIIDSMTEDLKSKRSIYEADIEHLKTYLDNKYFSRMDDLMKEKTVRSFWKFVFYLDNPECNENRLINRRTLEILIPEIKEKILEDMRKNVTKYPISDSKVNKRELVVLLSHIPEIYNVLDSDLKYQIDDFIDNHAELWAVSWFHKESLDDFYRNLSVEKNLGRTILQYMYRYAAESGKAVSFLDYTIRYLEKSDSFDKADIRWGYAIEPFINMYSAIQLQKILEVVNENDQIYNRGRAYDANAYLAKEICEKIDGDYDFSRYKKFHYNEERFQELKNQEENSGEMDL